MLWLSQLLMKKHLGIILLLLFICALGIFLRIHNLSPFKIYPDSYQSLVIAQNIQDYQGVLGYLGNQGMLYPNFFSWTRPLYPLLILLINSFSHDFALAAQIIALGTSIFAIAVSFFLVCSLFRNYVYGLAAAFLLALSFQHIVWSGFIMSEPIGVFFLLLFLWSFFAQLKNKSQWGSPKDLLTGMLLGLAVLTRYEYAIISIPLIFLVCFISKKTSIRLANIFSAFSITIAACFFSLFPIESTFIIIWQQISDLLVKAAAAILTSLIAFYFIKRYFQQCSVFLKKALLIGVIAFPVLSFFIPSLFLFRNFIVHDPLISVTAFIGCFYLLKEKKYMAYMYFVIFSCVLLGMIYQHVNTTMDRYITHLLPFILIPASYGLIQLLRKKKPLILVLLLSLILFQSFHSYQGLRYMNNPTWFHPPYEELVANKIKSLPLIEDKPFIIVSEPEPYFLSLHFSTQSITDRYPYILFSGIPQEQRIVIIHDMGMRSSFPHFSDFLDKHMQDKKKTQFWTHETYLIAEQTKSEKYPVILYETTLRELLQRIKKTK